MEEKQLLYVCSACGFRFWSNEHTTCPTCAKATYAPKTLVLMSHRVRNIPRDFSVKDGIRKGWHSSSDKA